MVTDQIVKAARHWNLVQVMKYYFIVEHNQYLLHLSPLLATQQECCLLLNPIF